MNELKLRDVNWKEFIISDIFNVFTGALVDTRSIVAGRIPRITATDQNNGIAMFTTDVNHRNFRVFENFISVSFLGSAFYHKNKVSLDMKIHGLQLKNKALNENISKFLIPLIKQFTQKYSYGNQLSVGVLKRQKIILPVDNDNKINWQFMEDYIKQEQRKQVEKIVKYYEKQISDETTKIFGGVESLNKINWKEFFIGGEEGVFDIRATKSGIDKNKLTDGEGKIPYITRSDLLNGINLFVSDKQNQKYSIDLGNVITIGLDTQTIFYQSNSFFSGQNIQILSNPFIDKSVAHFIIPILKKQMEKFNWGGNGATLGRLNRTKIMLPINKKGEPDYNYMKEFIQIQEIKEQYKIIEFYKKNIALY